MVLESVLHIAAPVEVVWQVTEDVERWPEWTPTVDSVRRIDRGPFDVGSRARLKLPRQPESTWTVTQLTTAERFSWESRVLGVRMVATHEMASEAGGTRSLVRIEMTGVPITLLWPVMRASAQRMLEQENLGLKNRCESLTGT